jgi:hypothetical protein
MTTNWFDIQSLTEDEKTELKNICMDTELQRKLLDKDDIRIFILFDLKKQAELFDGIAPSQSPLAIFDKK